MHGEAEQICQKIVLMLSRPDGSTKPFIQSLKLSANELFVYSVHLYLILWIEKCKKKEPFPRTTSDKQGYGITSFHAP